MSFMNYLKFIHCPDPIIHIAIIRYFKQNKE